MNIDSKIDEAISILQHEYGSRFDGVAADLVAAEIRQQHQPKLPVELTRTFALLSWKVVQLVSAAAILSKDYFRLVKGNAISPNFEASSKIHLS
jgi:hypothetical protein